MKYWIFLGAKVPESIMFFVDSLTKWTVNENDSDKCCNDEKTLHEAVINGDGEDEDVQVTSDKH